MLRRISFPRGINDREVTSEGQKGVDEADPYVVIRREGEFGRWTSRSSTTSKSAKPFLSRFLP
jgi:hypothetical protein